MEDWKTKANEQLRHDIIADNPLLFKMAHRPMSETCMCWGIDCHDGWLQPIADACYKLEGLNAITYKLFRVRVQAAQIKEKFGTLHFYTDVVCDPGPIVRGYEKFMQWIFDKIGMLKFNTQWKVDKEAYTETRETELTKEQYEEEVKRNKNSTWCAFVEKDGKYFMRHAVYHSAVGHSVAKNHKILYSLWKRRHVYINLLRRLTRFNVSKVQHAVMALADSLQRKIVANAEKECYDVCEECGHHIGDKWSPRCRTTGWITYICKECADKADEEYMMDGALWRNGKMLKSKEEIDKEREEVEKELSDEDQD